MNKDKNRRIFTSESVTEGHPDKVCDQIADAILDDLLAKDPKSKVACEVIATTGLVLVMGEVTTHSYVDVQKIVRSTVDRIGYNRGKFGFDAENLAILVALDEQSPDIAQGVGDCEGAGDQGIMFGYACRETEEYMPLPITLAHKLAKKLTDVRKEKYPKELRPDGKTQVSVEYDEEGNVLRIDTILVSTQHDEEVSLDWLKKIIREEVINPVVPAHLIDENTKFYVNPTGRFVIGGPKGDSGLTGRKIIVDTYGGYAPHGGGSFSGKDPTKVDRSASYAIRWVAKNMVAAGFADKLQIQVSYGIGMAEPISICVDTFGTSKYSDEELINIIKRHFDLTPKGIIETLDLRRPIYASTAAYGHFGRSDLDLPWERLNKVEELKKELH
ncbi:MAG: methionine adenosyltransferase [Bacilli bacterium]|nr:methionine adenosyltransferase [Mollicutes bacterium]MDY3898737.1 methionine adenosyltransferase [Bacilli bacterium]